MARGKTYIKYSDANYLKDLKMDTRKHALLIMDKPR